MSNEVILIKKYLFIEADYNYSRKECVICFVVFGLMPDKTFIVIDQKTEYLRNVYHKAKIQDKIEDIQFSLNMKATNISII